MNLNRIKNNIYIDSNNCWIWLKSTNSAGYGQFRENKKYWTTHRYAYTCVKGLIPKDKVIRHTCHKTKCCNPKHLILGTQKQNYNDSLDNHIKASKKLRKTWSIKNIKYPTCKAASKATGIHQGTIIKYTKQGIFNISKYRQGCKRARVIPRI